MILTIVATAAIFAGASGDNRQAYSACLRDAVANAKIAKIPADGFKAYAHEACAAVEQTFKASLAAFNVKNGMGKKSAAEDAQVQIDDYVFSAEDRYRASIAPPRAPQVASSPSK